MDLFEVLTPGLQNSIWVDNYPEVIKDILMRAYKPELIRNWGISDLTIAPDGKILTKWFKRLVPLNDEELAKIF